LSDKKNKKYNKKSKSSKAKAIKVCVRKRPNIVGNNDDIIDTYKDEVIVYEAKTSVALEPRVTSQSFVYDRVYDNMSSNYDIFEQEIRHNLYDDKNYICYTYGETGSGKTYTIFGTNGVGGILEMSINHMIHKYKNICISAYEIYMNKIYDILNARALINMWECNDEMHFDNLQNVNCTFTNVDRIINIIKTTKTMGISSSNNNSSRSHTVILLTCGSKKILFVDLAGCESAKKSNNITKEQCMEMAEINMSILALKECIRALTNKLSRIPFRESKLTMILRDAFRGGYNSTMIATISPELSHVRETLNTLRYSQDLVTTQKIQSNKNNNNNGRHRSNSTKEPSSKILYENPLRRIISDGLISENDKKFPKIKHLQNVIKKENELYLSMYASLHDNHLNYKKQLIEINTDKNNILSKLFPSVFNSKY
jgi:kinesin family member 2/24